MLLVPPPVIALATALVQRQLTPERPPSVPRGAVAGALAMSSGALAGTSMRGFRRSGTTVDPVHPERASTLVTSGPYKLTRNPMYVGLAGVLAAHAVWRGSWTAMLPVAGFVAVIDRGQIRAEEVALSRRFGAEYASFRRSTPRWLDLRSTRVLKG